MSGTSTSASTSTNPSEQQCNNCRFFMNSRCQRYPSYEERSAGDWCGEWELTYPEQPTGENTSLTSVVEDDD